MLSGLHRYSKDDGNRKLGLGVVTAARPATSTAAQTRAMYNCSPDLTNHSPAYTSSSPTSSSDPDADDYRRGFLSSVHVLPKTGGQGGYDVYRASRVPAQKRDADATVATIGYSNKATFPPPLRRSTSTRSHGNRPDFTQSLSVDSGTRYSRNIANPNFKEKQKNKLERATSRMDFYRSSDFGSQTIPEKSATSPQSVRRTLTSSPGASKRIPGNYNTNTNNNNNNIATFSSSSRRLDVASKKEILVTAFVNGFGKYQQLQSRPAKSAAASKRFTRLFSFRPDSTNDPTNDPRTVEVSASAENGALDAVSRETQSPAFSSYAPGRETELYNGNSLSIRRKTDDPESADLECSCSLYHSHRLDGPPVNSFLTEVKEKRLERITASLRVTNEGRVDSVEDPRNVFWVPTLSFHPYVHGDPQPVEFGSLWPRHNKLQELLQNPGIQQTVLREEAVLTLCTMAVTCGPLHLLKCLIELALIRVDQQVQCGSGLLHLAVLARNVQSVSYLMAAKVSPNIRDRHGLTADKVCYSSQVRKQMSQRYLQGRDITRDKILLKASLQDKDTIFKMATSPQYYADIQRKLQSLDFNVNTECDNSGDFLLHIVCRSGLSQLPLLMSLMKIQGADIELCNVNGMTALMQASEEGNCVLCDVLICLFCANPNKTNSSSGKSALHYAAEGNHRKTVECLIRRGADVNIEDFDGLRPDDVPGMCSKTDDCCEVILFHRNRRLERLSDIVKKGQVVASQLFPTDLCVVDTDRHTLIMMAAIYNRSDTLDTLLSVSKATINAQHSRTGMTALAIAAQMGNSSAVGALLRYQANPDIADMKGFQPLHHAVLNNHELTVETFLQYFPHTYVGLFQACRLCKKTSIHTSLMQAWEKRQEEIVIPKLLGCALNGDAEELYLLLDDGDNINPKSGTGNWPLYLAVENGNLDVLRLIVQRGGDFLKHHPTTGATALHLACKMGQESIVSYLLQYCSNSSHKKNQPTVTPTSTTVSSTFLNGFPFMSLKTSRQLNQTSLEGSSSKPRDSQGEGRKLLYINAVDGNNSTALQVAAEKGHSRIVEMLIQHGASTALLDSYGNLVSCTQYEGVRIMIESHRQQHTREVFGCLSNKSRNVKKTLALLQTIWLPKFDHHLRNKEGSTPLMEACLLVRVPIIQFLLQSAVYANLNAVSNKNDLDSDADSGVLDPYSGSSKLKDEITISQSIDVTDAQEAKPQVAAGTKVVPQSQFLSNSMELFNQRRLDRIIRDANRPKGLSIYHSGMTSHVCAVNLIDGTSALHQALIGGDAHQILSLLLEADSGPLNLQDDKGETALHLACRLNRKKSVEFLLAQSGIDLYVRTLNGQLPGELSSNKSVQKMVEKATAFCPAPVDCKGTPDTADSPALSTISQSIVPATIDLQWVHEKYEELKRAKMAAPMAKPEDDRLEVLT